MQCLNPAGGRVLVTHLIQLQRVFNKQRSMNRGAVLKAETVQRVRGFPTRGNSLWSGARTSHGSKRSSYIPGPGTECNEEGVELRMEFIEPKTFMSSVIVRFPGAPRNSAADLDRPAELQQREPGRPTCPDEDLLLRTPTGGFGPEADVGLSVAAEAKLVLEAPRGSGLEALMAPRPRSCETNCSTFALNI